MKSSEDRKKKILCEFKGLWTGKCWIEKCCYKPECDKALTQLNAVDKPRIDKGKLFKIINTYKGNLKMGLAKEIAKRKEEWLR